MNTNSRVTDMILQAPRVRPNDIDHALSDQEILALEEFEHLWTDFVSRYPQYLPPGQKLKSCLDVQNQIEEVKISEQNVEMELQRQLSFFTQSKDQLDANFTKAMEEAALIQQEIIRNLDNEIDDVAIADQTLSKTLPWEHFFENLEAVTDEYNVSDGINVGTSTDSWRALKPSSQALFLANNLDQGEVAKAAMEGKSNAMLLRVFEIDNSLLKAQKTMLEQEIDRLERTTKSQKMLAKFLTEHNIWGLLTKNSGSTTTGGGARTLGGSTGTGISRHLKN